MVEITKSSSCRCATIVLSGCCFFPVITPSQSALALESATIDPAATAPATLRGVHFVPNLGQWDDQTASYAFRSQGMDIAFRDSSFTMTLRRCSLDALTGCPNETLEHEAL